MELPESLVRSIYAELKVVLDAVGGCDHRIGICCCDLIAILDALKEKLGE